MTAETNEQYDPLGVERFRYELALEINRFIAKSLKTWATCENSLCRRAKRCEGPNCECIAKWSESLPPLSPEQDRAYLTEFKKALAAHIRDRQCGAT